MKKRKINIISKFLFGLLSTIMILFAGIYNVNAAPASVELGETKGYISALVGTTPHFYIKALKDGTYVYCLNHNLTVAKNITEYKVGELDAGIAYIIQYSPKTGDYKKDYYIKQVAVWWYLDDVKGAHNLSSTFYGYSNTGLKKQAYDLKEAAKKNNTYAQTTIKLNYDGKTTLTNGYYVTSLMSVTSSNISTYSVSLSGAPSGTIIQGQDGSTKSTFNSNEKFLVKVPASAVKLGTTGITVNVQAKGTVNKAYQYKPQNSSIQNVATIFPEEVTVNSNTKITIEKSSSISISKVDATNSKELPGAKLSLYDASGKLVETWVSTTEPHVIKNLADGKYKLVEVNAPDGYVLNKDTVEFEVKNGGVAKPVVMVNYPASVSISKVDATNNKELPGAKLSLYNASGKLVETWVSTTEPHVIKNLADGKYKLVEVNAPDGYLLSKDTVEFEVKNGGVAKPVVMVNYPNAVTISKVDATNGEELPGAKLSLYNSKGKLVETWVSTNEKHVIKNLADGKYKLVEVNAPDGYVLNTDAVEFEVKNGIVAKPVVMVNYPNKTGVLISKQDITNSSELPGANLVIKNSAGEEVFNFISGVAPTYFDLKPGKYTLTEISAPDGYVLSTETIEFEVLKDGSIPKVVMYNAPEVEVPITDANVPGVVYVIGTLSIILGAYVLVKKTKATM